MCVSGGSDKQFVDTITIIDTPECLERVKCQLIVEILNLCPLLYKQNYKPVVGVLDSIYLIWISGIVYLNIKTMVVPYTLV